MLRWSLFGYWCGYDPLARALLTNLHPLAALAGMLKSDVAENGRAAQRKAWDPDRAGQPASGYG